MNDRRNTDMGLSKINTNPRINESDIERNANGYLHPPSYPKLQGDSFASEMLSF